MRRRVAPQRPRLNCKRLRGKDRSPSSLTLPDLHPAQCFEMDRKVRRTYGAFAGRC